MTDLEIIAAIVLIVAKLRDQFPRLDGKATMFGLTVVFGISLELVVGWGSGSVRELVLHGFGLALGAAGGMQAINYHASKTASATEAVILQSMRPPPAPPEIGSPRPPARVDPNA